jgi:hypothetical protein
MFSTHCQRQQVAVRPPRRAEPPWPPKIPGARSLNNKSTITTTTTIPELKTKTKPTPLPKPAAQTIKPAQQQQSKKQLPSLIASDTHTPHNPPTKQSSAASPPHIIPLQPPNNNNDTNNNNLTKKPKPPPPPPHHHHHHQQQQAAESPPQPRGSSTGSYSSAVSVNLLDSERLEKEIQYALNFLKTNLQLNGPGIPPLAAATAGAAQASKGDITNGNSTTTTLSSNEEKAESTRIQLTEALRSIRNTLKLRLQLLNTVLADTIFLMTRYLDHYDNIIRIEALSVIFQAILCFGNATLAYIDDHQYTGQQYNNSSSNGGSNGTKQQKTINNTGGNGGDTDSSGGKVIRAGQRRGSLIKELLKIATRHQENKFVQKNCNKILQIMAEKLHQESMMKILCRYAEDWSVPRMRAKAASLLVIVTYRIH